MHKILVFCLFSLTSSLPFGVAAQDQTPDDLSNFFMEDRELSGSISFTWQSDYIAKRVSRNIADEQMLWTDFTLNLPIEGTWVNFWHSWGFEDGDFDSSFGDEFDITLGWTGELTDDINAKFYVSYFNLFELEDWGKNDMLVYASDFSLDPLVWGEHSFTPGIQIEWLSVADEPLDGALAVFPYVTHKWEEAFGIESLTLKQTARLSWDDGFNLPGNSSDGLFFRYDAGLDWKLGNSGWTLTLPHVTYLTPLTDPSDGRGEEIGIGISISRPWPWW